MSVRRVGWPPDREAPTEVDTAKRFSEFVGNGLSLFEKVEQSHIDVIGKSADGALKETFQVTRLWDNPFWHSLNGGGGADSQLTQEQLSELVKDAIERKALRYGPHERRSLILLIDSAPEGILPSLIPSVTSDCSGHAKVRWFKEVWVVGSDRERTFKISSL